MYFMLIADQMTRQEILFLSVIVVPIVVIILQEFALLMTDLAGDRYQPIQVEIYIESLN